jgi:hypothetical protein
MAWEQALLGSIEKWDRICFEKEYVERECALCKKARISVLGKYSKTCIIARVGQACDHICADSEGIWLSTSNGPRHDRKPGCDADIQMYLFLCMLYHEYYGND